MNVQMVRKVLWGISFLGYGGGVVLFALNFLGQGHPAMVEPAAPEPREILDPNDDPYASRGAFKREFHSIWEARTGKAEKPPEEDTRTPPPLARENPEAELRAALMIQIAKKGSPDSVYLQVRGGKKRWLSPGQAIEVGENPAELLEVRAIGRVGKAADVVFRYKGVTVAVRWDPWSRDEVLGGAGSSRPGSLSRGPDGPDDEPEEDDLPPPRRVVVPDQVGSSETRQIRPNVFRVARGEWEEIATDIESYVNEVKPSVVFGSGGEVLGLKLNEVEQGTLAYQRGLREGDIVERINGDLLTSTDDLRGMMEKHQTADRIVVIVDRDGLKRTLTYNLSR